MANQMVAQAIDQLKAHLRFPVVKVGGQWWGGTINGMSHDLLYVFPLIGNYVEIDPIDDYRRGGRAFDIMMVDNIYQVFDYKKKKLIHLSDLGISYLDPALWVYRAAQGASWTKTIINPWPAKGQSHTLSYDALLTEA